MSEATRAIALTEAVKTVGAEGDAAAILAVAEKFHAFLQSDAKPNGQTSLAPIAAEPAKNAGTKSTAPAAAPKPAPAAKPAVKKPAAPPAKTEEQLAQEALDAAEKEQLAAEAARDAGTATVGKEAVGAVVAALLAANKRADAIALLKKYGASSVSGVKEEDYDAFVADGNESLGDLTA